MEILYYLATTCLILFMVLATFDGFYLHIFKYALYNHSESRFEHKTHTLRALLFPSIVWLLFVNQSNYNAFLIGVGLVLLDLIVLAIDAYSEKESRSFMGGLPRWEYIIHLLSNAFHFSTILLVLAIKFSIEGSTLVFVETITASPAKEFFTFISINVIPGGIILGLLHVALMLPRPRLVWNCYRQKITCC
ncbi:MAG: hypothetical protein WBM83_05480 [Flavobacteriaceae bacterium]